MSASRPPASFGPIICGAVRRGWRVAVLGCVTSTAGSLCTGIGLLAAVVLVPRGRTLEATIVFLAALLFGLAAAAAADRAARRIRRDVLADVESRVWTVLLDRPVHFFTGRSVRELLSYAAGVSLVRRLAGPLAVESMLSAVAVGISTLVLAAIDPWLAMRAAVVAVGIAACTTQLAHRQQQHDAAVMDGVEGAQATLYPALVGYEEVLGYGAARHVYERWSGEFAAQKRADAAGLRCGDAAAAVLRATPAIFVAVLVPAVAGGSDPVGLGATAVIALQAGSAVARLVPAIPALFSLALVGRRLRPLLAHGPATDVAKRTATPSGTAMTMVDVSFGHAGSDQPLLAGASLEAPAGALTAIIGPSGCGKTTVLQLLLGLAEPAAGAVALGGTPISRIPEAVLRRRLAIVPQSGTLLRGTLRDAVRGFRDGIDDAAVVEALDRVGLGGLLDSLPMWLDTPVTDGRSGFSGGQEQRILIARALAARPDVLLLDEATSALDEPSEREVAAAIAALPITRVVVAHRLATVRNADRVLLLVGGRLEPVTTRDPARLAALVATARHAYPIPA